MRCLTDVSRGMCEVMRGFLLEFSGSCGLERDTWMIDIANKACCVKRYTIVDPWLCIVRLGVEQQYGESPDI